MAAIAALPLASNGTSVSPSAAKHAKDSNFAQILVALAPALCIDAPMHGVTPPPGHGNDRGASLPHDAALPQAADAVAVAEPPVARRPAAPLPLAAAGTGMPVVKATARVRVDARTVVTSEAKMDPPRGSTAPANPAANTANDAASRIANAPVGFRAAQNAPAATSSLPPHVVAEIAAAVKSSADLQTSARLASNAEPVSPSVKTTAAGAGTISAAPADAAEAAPAVHQGRSEARIAAAMKNSADPQTPARLANDAGPVSPSMKMAATGAGMTIAIPADAAEAAPAIHESPSEAPAPRDAVRTARAMPQTTAGDVEEPASAAVTVLASSKSAVSVEAKPESKARDATPAQDDAAAETPRPDPLAATLEKSARAVASAETSTVTVPAVDATDANAPLRSEQAPGKNAQLAQQAMPAPSKAAGDARDNAVRSPLPSEAAAQSVQPAPAATEASRTAPGAMPAAATAASTPPATLPPGAAQPAPQPNIGALAAAIANKSLNGARTFEIRMDPPELGRVDVHLTIDRDGQARASLCADRPQTLDLLQRDSQSLERALKDAGLDLSNNGLNFSLKGGDRQGDGGGASVAHTRSLQAVAVAQGDAVSASDSIASLAPNSARLDIRV